MSVDQSGRDPGSRVGAGDGSRRTRHRSPCRGVADKSADHLFEFFQSLFGKHHGRPGSLHGRRVGSLMSSTEAARHEHRGRVCCGDLGDGSACTGDEQIACCVEVLHRLLEPHDDPRYTRAGRVDAAHVPFPRQVEQRDLGAAPRRCQMGYRVVDGACAQTAAEHTNDDVSRFDPVPGQRLMTKIGSSMLGQVCSDRCPDKLRSTHPAGAVEGDEGGNGPT